VTNFDEVMRECHENEDKWTLSPEIYNARKIEALEVEVRELKGSLFLVVVAYGIVQVALVLGLILGVVVKAVS
jgi:hypothetical protein